MAATMTANGKKIKFTEKDQYSMQTEIIILVSLLTEWSMETEGCFITKRNNSTK